MKSKSGQNKNPNCVYITKTHIQLIKSEYNSLDIFMQIQIISFVKRE